jgi:hypothetical protein
MVATKSKSAKSGKAEAVPSQRRAAAAPVNNEVLGLTIRAPSLLYSVPSDVEISADQRKREAALEEEQAQTWDWVPIDIDVPPRGDGNTFYQHRLSLRRS